ncbi:MAG: PAP/fibrillin family protein [Cyanobacteriota bacterium]|nr:PAP/fibrillin family protein [Cyanobacteriota bacterium]
MNTAKTQLLELVAGTNRGLLAAEKDRIAILSAIERLEDDNPNPQPLAQTELLAGDWRLLYTSSRGILGLGRLPVIDLGQVYQCIRFQGNRLYNLAEINGLPWLEGLVCVVATFSAASERRLEVKFERSIIGLQKVLGYQSPHQFIRELEGGKKYFPLDFSLGRRENLGWLEITYLDEDLRLGRGSEGNVFILSKG